jgi:holo-[acyl-carrier protein] synthase
LNVLGIGTEITECLRVAKIIDRHGERFIDRVYTAAETRYCHTRKHATQYFTAFWAAKEAVFKALNVSPGRGIRAVDLELRPAKGRKFTVALRGALRDVVEQQGVREIIVTLSYSRSHAVACAMALGEAKPPDDGHPV